MRPLFFLALAVLPFGVSQQHDEVKKDLEKLQGNWTMVALEVQGALVPPERFTKATLVVKGDRYLVNSGKENTEVAITINPYKDPKEIDMTFLDGPNKNLVGKGIYAIEGDTFKIGRGLLPEQERPLQFATNPKSTYYVVTWKRQP